VFGLVQIIPLYEPVVALWGTPIKID
jgi:hypothetical protein